jgi:hypothetical protein
VSSPQWATHCWVEAHQEASKQRSLRCAGWAASSDSRSAAATSAASRRPCAARAHQFPDPFLTASGHECHVGSL